MNTTSNVTAPLRNDLPQGYDRLVANANDLGLIPNTINGHSKAWDNGFSAGFLSHLGVPTKVTNVHTMEYWYGYANGTLALRYDNGYADGSSGLQQSFHDTSDSYLQGYQDGKYAIGPNCQGREFVDNECVPSKLPTHTDDHYLRYFGYENGQRLALFYSNVTTPSWTDHCALNHSTEYCAGFNNEWEKTFVAAYLRQWSKQVW